MKRFAGNGSNIHSNFSCCLRFKGNTADPGRDGYYSADTGCRANTDANTGGRINRGANRNGGGLSADIFPIHRCIWGRVWTYYGSL